jgi:hypothetical protein
MQWMQAAADQGYAAAQFYLGEAHLNGVNASLDPPSAVRFLQLSADQGYAEALHSLGRLYLGGQIVPQDQPRAFMYFDLAVRLGDPTAAGEREEMSHTLPANQQQLAKRRAQEWLQARGL